MAKTYTINNAGSQSDSPDLVNCKIVEIEGYQLQKSDGTPLANSLSRQLPVTFSFNNYDDYNWTLTISDKQGLNMSGTWTNTDDPADETDSWTATGTGGDEGADEAKAASANQ